MEITTIKDLFNALGGAKTVSHMMNVSPTAVYMAINRETIPHRWRLAIYQEIKRRRMNVAPQLLGMEAA